MAEREMFEKSFVRPTNYFKLSKRQKWAVGKRLGILDWIGKDLSKADIKLFKEHYG